MKTLYAVKKIDYSKLPTITVETVNEAFDNAPEHICNGLQEVFEYCGCKLRRLRMGYSGLSSNGNIEYSAYRI